ncbi:hypothetical protein LSAT2_014915 [Lamellibrachia satsuma]|nr:hypothetical protein LSAT2_014915 [Lamellibrachia satsuma]
MTELARLQHENKGYIGGDKRLPLMERRQAIHHGCISETMKLQAEYEQAITELARLQHETKKEPDVDMEVSSGQGAGCLNTAMHDGCISQTTKLQAENE